MITGAVTAHSVYPPGWIYATYPLWSEQFTVWCQWVMENWQGDKPPKVALIGPDAHAGPPAIEPAIPYVESMGVEMLPSEFVPWVPLDTTSQLLRLKERGANYVFITPVWSVAVPILRDAERLGLMGEIHFAGTENTQSEKTLAALGAAAEGYTAPRPHLWCTETEIPGIKLMRDLRLKYGGEYYFFGDDANCIVMVSVAVEAIKSAIEEVGYENLDSRAVKEALDNMKDFDAYGIRRITYTPDDHRGDNRVKIYQVIGGKVVSVSDWMEAPMIIP